MRPARRAVSPLRLDARQHRQQPLVCCRTAQPLCGRGAGQPGQCLGPGRANPGAPMAANPGAGRGGAFAAGSRHRRRPGAALPPADAPAARRFSRGALGRRAFLADWRGQPGQANRPHHHAAVRGHAPVLWCEREPGLRISGHRRLEVAAKRTPVARGRQKIHLLRTQPRRALPGGTRPGRTGPGRRQIPAPLCAKHAPGLALLVERRNRVAHHRHRPAGAARRPAQRHPVGAHCQGPARLGQKGRAPGRAGGHQAALAHALCQGSGQGARQEKHQPLCCLDPHHGTGAADRPVAAAWRSMHP